MGHIEMMKSGFFVIPFKLPKYDVLKSDKPPMHYMFVKKHQNKIQQEANCLFIVNLPLLSNLNSIKSSFNNICEKFNTVAHITELLYHDEFGLQDVDLSVLTSDLLDTNDLKDKRYTPNNTVLLKFLDEASLDNCWNALRKYSHMPKELVQWEYSIPSVSSFTNFYKHIEINWLKENIHKHMKLFEEREQQAQEQVQSTIVDDDGFTLVVGKNTKSLNSIRRKILNRNPLLKHSQKVIAPSIVDKKAKKDFYRFQVRERKKQEINELLKKFKEDQERIKIMKSQRKFNPYA
ncbi:Rrp7p Ecym_1049 [Eremothecium cymbalariae DBVPG|uniref:Ribosomal RNA-processing protein 7 C-terminal domain-containing protein n=1 Tax=Eremothecium cymbalariae (strain CBS 270.75 / DBVPG 7215 / KCTC 17166 / NRRL Y-17582) TaxID=931890 RepID=G8JM98_ERECY|nr:hypothetical protein Ecym_1049 [Eremothecium cymbalariae DBVPG\